MKRRLWIRAAWFSVLVVGACGEAVTLDNTDSETHWLSLCNTNADCEGDGTCSCGFCTQACTLSLGCGEVSDKAVCLQTSAIELCAGEAIASARLCVEQCDGPADCGSGSQCLSGTCVIPNPDLDDLDAGADAGMSMSDASAGAPGAGGSAGAGGAAGAGGTAGTPGSAGVPSLDASVPEIEVGEPISDAVVSSEAIAECEAIGGIAYRGLCWENPPTVGINSPDAPWVDFDSAERHCNQLQTGGYAWSLPTTEELFSLIVPWGPDCGMRCLPFGDGGCDWFTHATSACPGGFGPSENGCYWHPQFEGACDSFWTSTVVPDSEPSYEYRAVVSFVDVTGGALPTLNYLSSVRCVSELASSNVVDAGAGDQ